jgi:kumamolisin
MPKRSPRRAELNGSEPVHHHEARPVRRVHAGRVIEVSLHLGRRGTLAPLTRHADVRRHEPRSHQSLHVAHGSHRHGSLIEAFAREHHLEVAREDHGARTVVLRGRVTDMARAFGADLVHYRHGKDTYRSHDAPLRVPAHLAPVVEAVLGLDDRPGARPHLQHFSGHQPRVPDIAHYATRAVGRAYGFPDRLDGWGQTIGIIELGGGFRRRDLDVYFRHMDLPRPNVKVVSVNGAKNRPTGHPRGADGEVALDIEVAGSIAPAATLVVYYAPCSERGFVDAVKAAVHDTVHRPSILSVSWGNPEPYWSRQAMRVMNQVLHEAAALGVTVCTSSGDLGASAGLAKGLAVEFPASSPYALACGGTRLIARDGRVRSEVVWDDLSEKLGAGGGGISVRFGRPHYQAGRCDIRSPEGKLGRGVPDVAGNADPETGYLVRVDDRWLRFGGTSAVAPLWAGLVALCNQALHREVGFINPLLYRAHSRRIFRPVTRGSNGGYRAGPGWNPCAGLGVADGGRLLELLRRDVARPSTLTSTKAGS